MVSVFPAGGKTTKVLVVGEEATGAVLVRGQDVSEHRVGHTGVAAIDEVVVDDC
jgi:hypothetical protein